MGINPSLNSHPARQGFIRTFRVILEQMIEEKMLTEAVQKSGM